MRHARLLALAVAVSLAILTIATPARAMDLDDYQSALESASAALDGSNADRDGALAALRAIEPVTLPTGVTVEPDLSAIVAALESEPPDIAAAQHGIDALLGALSLASASTIDSDEARTTLDEVLARKEFQPTPEDEDDSQSLSGRFFGWIGGHIDRFFSWLDRIIGGQGGEGSPFSIVLAVLGVLLIVGIVAFAVRSVRESLTPGVARLTDIDAEAHYTSAQARAEAERLFAAGEYRAALRLLYLATLIRWEEAGRLRFDRSLTNREVVARVTLQGDASLLEQLRPLVDRFDRVWYGGAQCTAEDYTQFASLAERAWEAA